MNSSSQVSSADSNEPAASQDPARFHTTHWTLVVSASQQTPQGEEALRRLCASYYEPVRQFVVRNHRSANDITDIVHEFFARFISGNNLRGVDKLKGSFRSYLLGAVRHFLSDFRDRERAIKRGAGQSVLSLQSGSTKSGDRTDVDDSGVTEIDVPDVSAFPSDAFFDRDWGFNLLNRALERLRAEGAERQRERQVEVLAPWLTGNAAGPLTAEIAGQLQVAHGSLKVILHHLRKRFRELIREELSWTVDNPADIDGELAYLIDALSAYREVHAAE